MILKKIFKKYQIKLIKDLFEVGLHYGHNYKYWHPSMKPYIYTKQQNIHIINLKKTSICLFKISIILKKIIKKKGKILFVCTKPIANDLIKDLAIKLNQFYINYKWLGGMLTNLETIKKSIHKLKKLERGYTNTMLISTTKRENYFKTKQLLKLKIYFEGIKNMKKLPKLLFVIDGNNESIAINEAKILNIKTSGIIDTNTNANNIDYIIPANDDCRKGLIICLNFIKNIVLNDKYVYE